MRADKVKTQLNVCFYLLLIHSLILCSNFHDMVIHNCLKLNRLMIFIVCYKNCLSTLLEIDWFNAWSIVKHYIWEKSLYYAIPNLDLQCNLQQQRLLRSCVLFFLSFIFHTWTWKHKLKQITWWWGPLCTRPTHNSLRIRDGVIVMCNGKWL